MKLNLSEIEIAKVFDNLKLDWNRNLNGFEYVDIENRPRKYYPDFYLRDYNVYM